MRIVLFALLVALGLWLLVNITHLVGGRGITVPFSGFGAQADQGRGDARESNSPETAVEQAPAPMGAASNANDAATSLTAGMPKSLGVLSVLFALCGSLGATLHAVGSLVAFIGNEKFKSSWAGWYLAQPLRGAMLATGFFWLLQGGLLGGIGVGQTPVNSIAMMGATFLVGLFSDPAIEKLREVFQVLFRTADKPRKDALASVRRPTITVLKLDVSSAAAPLLKISGSDFEATDEVWVNSKLLPVAARTGKSLDVSLAQVPTTGSSLRVVVIPVQANADPSNAMELKVP